MTLNKNYNMVHHWSLGLKNSDQSRKEGGFIILAFFVMVNSNMSDDKLERVISQIVMDLMLEAFEQGKTLSYSDICKMADVTEEQIDTDWEADNYFTINEEFVDAVQDKELRSAMIERAFSTLH